MRGIEATWQDVDRVKQVGIDMSYLHDWNDDYGIEYVNDPARLREVLENSIPQEIWAMRSGLTTSEETADDMVSIYMYLYPDISSDGYDHSFMVKRSALPDSVLQAIEED